eukprot:485694_1
MALQIGPNLQPQRAKQRQKYWSKLVSNVRFDDINTNQVSFNINNCSEHLTWQRKPFYDITTIDFYMFTLSSLSVKLLSKDNNKSQHVQMLALIGLEIKLYSLNASHPNFCVIKNHSKPINNASGIIHTLEIYLYQKNETLTLLSYIKSAAMAINPKRTVSLSQKRIVKKKYISSKSQSIDNFPFCAPAMIGDCNQKCVFLSDLKIKNSTMCCDGLICLENGFDSHPWVAGTGDHINSNHVLGSSMQFIYLLIRNCKYDKFSTLILKNKNTKILKQYNQCHLVIFNANVQYKKFIELGQYEIELTDLSTMTNLEIQQSCICKQNVLFGFKIQLNIKQNNNICISAKFDVCPLYLLANL